MDVRLVLVEMTGAPGGPIPNVGHDRRREIPVTRLGNDRPGWSGVFSVFDASGPRILADKIPRLLECGG
jgi:hypothetical protein